MAGFFILFFAQHTFKIIFYYLRLSIVHNGSYLHRKSAIRLFCYELQHLASHINLAFWSVALNGETQSYNNFPRDFFFLQLVTGSKCFNKLCTFLSLVAYLAALFIEPLSIQHNKNLIDLIYSTEKRHKFRGQFFLV